MRTLCVLLLVLVVPVALSDPPVALEKPTNRKLIKLATTGEPAVPIPTVPVIVTNFPVDETGHVRVVEQNLATRPVEVVNLPAVQSVEGTVNIGNLPTVQSVAGTVNVGNLPLDSEGNLRVAKPDIENVALELMSTPFEIPADNTNHVWSSEYFDTSRFNLIVLKVTSQGYIQQLTCSTCWRFTEDEDCTESGPVYGYHGSRLPMASVSGLEARVICDGSASAAYPQGGYITSVKVLLRRE